MARTVAAAALVGVLWAYTVTAALCLWPRFDRWARNRSVGNRRLRSLLPFWGLFAQAGMYDVHVWYRTVPATGAPSGWSRLAGSHRTAWSWLWRPVLRDDQCSVVLGRQMVAIRASSGPGAEATHLIPYQRVTSRARAAARSRAEVVYVQWCVRATRGFWSTEPELTVFMSKPEPVTGRCTGSGGGANGAPPASAGSPT